jgi:hypothetical protein
VALRRYAGTTATDARLRWELPTARSVGELLPLLDGFGRDVRIARRRRALRTIDMLKLFLSDADDQVRRIHALDCLQPETPLNDSKRCCRRPAGGAAEGVQPDSYVETSIRLSSGSRK